MEDLNIINKEDKAYYDEFFKFSVYSGASIGSVTYGVYASCIEQALELAVAFAELHDSHILFDFDSIRDYVYTTFEDEYRDWLSDKSGEEYSYDESWFEFAQEYLNYIYVDATEYGASQPYFIDGTQMSIEEANDEPIVFEDKQLNEKIETNIDRKYFNIMFQLDRLRIFEVNYVKKNIYSGSIGKTSSNFEVVDEIDGFSTSADLLPKSKRGISLCGQAQEEILANYPKAYAFYKKWDTKHLGSLTDDEYTEMMKDLDVLKNTYNYVEQPAEENDPRGISFYTEVELSMMKPKNKVGESADKKEEFLDADVNISTGDISSNLDLGGLGALAGLVASEEPKESEEKLEETRIPAQKLIDKYKDTDKVTFKDIKADLDSYSPEASDETIEGLMAQVKAGLEALGFKANETELVKESKSKKEETEDEVDDYGPYYVKEFNEDGTDIDTVGFDSEREATDYAEENIKKHPNHEYAVYETASDECLYLYDKTYFEESKSKKEETGSGVSDEFWGINTRSRATGNEAVCKWAGKYIAFTSKDEAVKCIKAMDDENGNINNFMVNTLVDLSYMDEEDLLVFNTYEEYKDYTEKYLEDKMKRDEEEQNKQAKLRDDIMYKISNDLTEAGFNVIAVGEDAITAKHHNSNDICIYPSIYCDIILYIGVGHNGYNYGTRKYKVNKDGLISTTEYEDFKSYDEYRDKIIKDVRNVVDKNDESISGEYQDIQDVEESKELKTEYYKMSDDEHIIWDSEIDFYDEQYMQDVKDNQYQDYLDDLGEDEEPEDFESWYESFVNDDLSYSEYDFLNDDLENNILPEIDKQLNDNVLLLSGSYGSNYPDFKPSGDGGVLWENGTDDFRSYISGFDRVCITTQNGILGAICNDHDGTVSGQFYTLPDDKSELIKAMGYEEEGRKVFDEYDDYGNFHIADYDNVEEFLQDYMPQQFDEDLYYSGIDARDLNQHIDLLKPIKDTISGYAPQDPNGTKIENKEIKTENKEIKTESVDEDTKIEKAIKEYIDKSNGIFTDDSAYDIAETITGIKDIDKLPDGLVDNIRNILHTKFKKEEDVDQINEVESKQPSLTGDETYVARNSSGYKSIGLIVNNETKQFQIINGQVMTTDSKTKKMSKKQIRDKAQQLYDKGYEEYDGYGSVAQGVNKNEDKEIKTEGTTLDQEITKYKKYIDDNTRQHLEKLEKDLLAIDGVTGVEYDLAPYANDTESPIILVKYDQENTSFKLLKSVIETIQANGVKVEIDELEDNDTYFYIVTYTNNWSKVTESKKLKKENPQQDEAVNSFFNQMDKYMNSKGTDMEALKGIESTANDVYKFRPEFTDMRYGDMYRALSKEYVRENKLTEALVRKLNKVTETLKKESSINGEWLDKDNVDNYREGTVWVEVDIDPDYIEIDYENEDTDEEWLDKVFKVVQTKATEYNVKVMDLIQAPNGYSVVLKGTLQDIVDFMYDQKNYSIDKCIDDMDIEISRAPLQERLLGPSDEVVADSKAKGLYTEDDNEGAKDEIKKVLGVEPGSDEEAQIDDIFDTDYDLVWDSLDDDEQEEYIKVAQSVRRLKPDEAFIDVEPEIDDKAKKNHLKADILTFVYLDKINKKTESKTDKPVKILRNPNDKNERVEIYKLPSGKYQTLYYTDEKSYAGSFSKFDDLDSAVKQAQKLRPNYILDESEQQSIPNIKLENKTFKR